MNSTEQPSTDFFALETALHKKSVRNSPDAVAALLADDFMEFGRSGTIYTKATIIELLKGETVDSQVTVENFQSRELGPGVALVTYISSRPVEIHEETIRVLRSSIWKFQQDRWQMIFHQGTIMRD
jgi:hypothetical protein